MSPSAAVAACNDQLLADGGDDVFLAKPAEGFALQSALLRQVVDGLAVAYRAHQNAGLLSMACKRGRTPCHPLEIGAQIGGCSADAPFIVGIHKNGDGIAARKQQRTLLETDEAFCTPTNNSYRHESQKH